MAVEETFQQAKGQVGLDHYQCRGWKPWHRFTILAMLALAVLTITTAALHTPSNQVIALTVAEVRRLLNVFTARISPLAHVLHWSIWRRRHQAQAKASHRRRRAQIEAQLSEEP